MKGFEPTIDDCGYERISRAPTCPEQTSGYDILQSDEEREAFREAFYAREERTWRACIASDGTVMLQINPVVWPRFETAPGKFCVRRPKPVPVGREPYPEEGRDDRGRKNTDAIAMQLGF